MSNFQLAALISLRTQLKAFAHTELRLDTGAEPTEEAIAERVSEMVEELERVQ